MNVLLDQHFINGALVAPVKGKYIDVIDPSSEEVYGRSASGTAEDIDGAVAAAKADLPSWGKTTGVERGKILRAIADAMERNTPELADKEAVNAGKPPSVREDSTSSSFPCLS